MGVNYNGNPAPRDGLLLYYDGRNRRSFSNNNNWISLTADQTAFTLNVNTAPINGFLGPDRGSVQPINFTSLNAYNTVTFVTSFSTSNNIIGTLISISENIRGYYNSGITVAGNMIQNVANALSTTNYNSATLYSNSEVTVFGNMMQNVINVRTTGNYNGATLYSNSGITVFGNMLQNVISVQTAGNYNGATLYATSGQTTYNANSTMLSPRMPFTDIAWDYPEREMSVALDKSGRGIVVRVKNNEFEQNFSITNLDTDQTRSSAVYGIVFKKSTGNTNHIKIYRDGDFVGETANVNGISSFSNTSIQLFGNKFKARETNAKIRTFSLYSKELTETEAHNAFTVAKDY